MIRAGRRGRTQEISVKAMLTIRAANFFTNLWQQPIQCPQIWVKKTLYQSRADNSFEKELLKLLAPDLLIIDDFGLQALTKQQSTDFYELIIERHARSSTIITSNRHVDEWIALFDDQILANSAVDRFAHNAHQFVIEGESYRRMSAKQRGLTGQ